MEPQNIPKPEKRQRVKTTTKRKKPLEQEVLLRKGCWGGPGGPGVKLPDGVLGGPLKVENNGGMDEWKAEGWQQRNGHVDMPSNASSILPPPSATNSAPDPENPMSLPPQSNNSQLGHENDNNNGSNNNDLLSHGGSIKTPGSLPPTPSSQHSQNQQQQAPQNPQQTPQMNCRPLSNIGPGGLVVGRGRPQSTGMPEGLTSGSGGGNGPGGHFMSQQSQIFVFSTGLANEAAEVVQRGQCRSIVDFHLDTPATRQFLQNFPLGANSFNRPQSMPPFLDNNNMAKFPSKDHQPPPMPFNETGSALANVELWVQQQNASLQEGPFSPSFGPSGNSKQSRNNRNNNSSGQRWLPSPSNRMTNNPQMDFGPDHPMHIPPGYMPDPQMPPGRGMMPASLDENITPEQLQRREEQLAQLQKIKNMLFPEKRNEFGGRPHPGMYGPPRPGPDGMMGMIRFPPGHPSNMMGPGGIGMMDAPHDQMMGLEMDPAFFNGNGPLPPGLPPNWENMSNEEREWFKLQHEYYMERQKHQMQMSRNNGGPPPPPGYFGEMGPQSRMPGPHSPVSPSFAMNRDPSGFFFQGPPPPGMNFPQNGPGPHPPDFHPDLMQGGMPEGMFFGPNGPIGPRMHHPHDPMTPMGPFGPGGARFPNMCKPKRRRNNGGEKAEDIYRHLQPAPPPEQFCSLNLIEGQEVTITRQLNLAYQDPSDDRSPSQQNFNNLQHSQQQPKKKRKSDNNTHDNNDPNKTNNSHDNNNQRNFDFENNKMPKSISHQQHNIQKAPSMEKQEMLDSQSPSANFSNNNNNINSLPHSSGPPNLKANNSMSNMVSPAGLSKGMEGLSDRMDNEGMQGGMYRNNQMSENDNSSEGILSNTNNQQGIKIQPPDPSDKAELMSNNSQDNKDNIQKNFENEKMMSLKSLSHQHSVEKQEMPNECSPSQNFNNNNNNNHNNNSNNLSNNNNNSNNNPNLPIGSGGMPSKSNQGGVMNNITSPTLASLAKGVESLSGRIEQDMLQGGLFRTVQMPENESEFPEEVMANSNNQASNKNRANSINGNNNNSNSNNNNNCNSNNNNNNNNGNNNGNSSNSNSNNNKSNNGGNNNGDASKGENINQENSMNNRGSFEFFGNEKMSGMKSMPGHPQDKRSPHMFPPDMKAPPQSMMSPRMHGMIGNANVQIEASAPNTIQYMPARPPTDQGSDNPSHQMPPPGYNGPDYGPVMGMDGNPMFDNNFMVPPNFDGGPMGGGPNDINGPGGPGYGGIMPRGFNAHNMPGFNNGQNGPIGFDSQGGAIFEGSLPPGMGGPMIPGYNGPPPPGFPCQPPFPNGHPGHMHPGMMPGFDGHCGPMGDFDGPMPQMPPYGNFGPRGQCGPMMGGGFHPGGPMAMNHPELFGHRMPMMPVEGKINENPRGKEGGTKKEKERKKRSESKKANSRNMADKAMAGAGIMNNNMRPGSALMMNMGGPEMGMRPGADMMMGHPAEMMMQGPDGIMLPVREGGMSRAGMARMMMPDMDGMICRNGPMNPMMDMPNGGDMFHGPMMMEGDQFNNGHPPPPFDMMRPEANFNGGGIISGDPGLGR